MRSAEGVGAWREAVRVRQAEAQGSQDRFTTDGTSLSGRMCLLDFSVCEMSHPTSVIVLVTLEFKSRSWSTVYKIYKLVTRMEGVGVGKYVKPGSEES